MGMSEKHISHLINGEVQLTSDVAYRLEMVLGLPANFWNNLEAIYREKLAKAEVENALDADKELAQKFPYKEMAKNGWLPDTSKIEERVINLRKFFEVVQLERLTNSNLLPKIACRRLSITEKSDFALISWVQRARIVARGLSASPIDINELTKQLPRIRAMTTEDPTVFCPQLLKLLSNCGVTLIFCHILEAHFCMGQPSMIKIKLLSD